MARPSVEAERREQILRAACEVVSDKGYKALRVTDVAKRAKISTGSVHYYFETKRDLVHAAFEWNFARSLERRKSILDRHSNARSEEHTSELQSRENLVCRLLLEKKKETIGREMINDM